MEGNYTFLNQYMDVEDSENILRINSMDVFTNFSINSSRLEEISYELVVQNIDSYYAFNFVKAFDEFMLRSQTEIIHKLIARSNYDLSTEEISSHLDRLFCDYISSYQNCMASCLYTLLAPDFKQGEEYLCQLVGE